MASFAHQLGRGRGMHVFEWCSPHFSMLIGDRIRSGDRRIG